MVSETQMDSSQVTGSDVGNVSGQGSEAALEKRLLSPPGLSGGGRPWEEWEKQDAGAPKKQEHSSPPLNPSSLPFVPPPPGLAGQDRGEEVANGEVNAKDHPSLLSAAAVPFDDCKVYGLGGDGNGYPAVRKLSNGSPNNGGEGAMTVTSLPAEEWKAFFPAEFGGRLRQCYEWEDEEPAVVRPSDGMGGSRLADSQERPAYVKGVGGSTEATRLASEHEMLSSENARLAMENEMLRKKNMQLAWGGASAPESEGQTNAAAASYWAELGYPMDMSMALAGGPNFFPNPWMNMMWAQGDWRMGKGASLGRLGAAAQPKKAASRARTDSDIPAHIPARTSPRNRTLSAGDADGSPVTAQCVPESGPCTTVMLRNLPNNYSRAMLLKLLDGEGFLSQYDFVYLPMDFKSHASLGYAFVNLVSSEQAANFWEAFEGFSRWVVPSQKVCSVSWSHPYQGLEAHIERYRNSPVMHEDVPDEYKPMVFNDGERGSFPPPTKKLRAPRMRLSGGDAAHGETASPLIEEES